MKHPITLYRDHHKLTMEAFGALVGVRKSIVWKWENGAQPSPKLARAIADRTAGTELAILAEQLRPDLWPPSSPAPEAAPCTA